MQVAPLARKETEPSKKHAPDTALGIAVSSFEPLLRQQRADLRIESGRRNGAEAESSFAPAPPSSADVINESERDVETGSRAYRREVAREQGREQFQQDRAETRQALKQKAESGHGSATGQVSSPSDAKTSNTSQPATNAESRTAERPAADSTRREVAAQPADSGGSSNKAAKSSATASHAAPVETAAATPNARAHSFVNHVQSNATAALSASAGVGVKAGASVGAKAQGQFAFVKPEQVAARGRSFAAAKNAATQAMEQDERAENIRRIVRIAARRMRGQHSHTVMRLDPPELGSLRLEMDLRGDVMRLRIDASTHVAHRLLSESLDKLRQSLEASGIQLEKVEVRPPTPTPEADPQASLEHSDTPNEGGGRFEEADAEHSRGQGTEFTPPSLEEFESDETPATESLVNVIA